MQCTILTEEAARMKAGELSFLKFIKKERKKSMKLDRENGYYIEPIIYADITRVVQSSGRHKLVIHDQFHSPLTQDDEMIPIEYKDGLGMVILVKHVDRSLGRQPRFFIEGPASSLLPDSMVSIQPTTSEPGWVSPVSLAQGHAQEL